MMVDKNPVVWFEIYVDDLARATKFYEEVFQFRLSELPAPEEEAIRMAAFPSDMESKNMASGALVKMEGVCAGNNSTLVYFHSEDCSVEAGRAPAAGGRVERPKTSLGEYGFMSLVADTEGNMIGIHSMA